MKIFTFFLVLLTAAGHLCFAKFDSTANLSSTWIINYHPLVFGGRSADANVLLLGGASSFRNGTQNYACGFFCNGSCKKYLFAIFIVTTHGDVIEEGAIPPVVWSANPDFLVSLNSTLQLTSDGDLVLKDVDGATAWSTNTSGKSVVGMNMTETGNLVLYNLQNETAWQSFDHPTDALLPGQRLFEGQTLTSSTSATNWTRGFFFLFRSLGMDCLLLYKLILLKYITVLKNIIQCLAEMKQTTGQVILNLRMGVLSIQFQYMKSIGLYIPSTSSTQYIKLGSDGHLKVYEWEEGNTDRTWGIVSDLLSDFDNRVSDCAYPMVCGEYGICLNGQCSCLAATNNEISIFEPINVKQPNQGCRLRSPLSCGASQYHEFLEFKDISYFSLIPDIVDTDMKTCKEACLRNCSCKAAFFHPYSSSNSKHGTCFRPSDIFSLMTNNDKKIYSFVKVQGTPPAKAGAPPPARNKNVRSKVIVQASVGVVFGLFFLIRLIVILLVRKSKDIDEEEYLDQVPGMPTRFS